MCLPQLKLICKQQIAALLISSRAHTLQKIQPYTERCQRSVSAVAAVIEAGAGGTALAWARLGWTKARPMATGFGWCCAGDHLVTAY
eukprot:6091989-Pleurochrysis_carterae.AAC.7